MASAYRSMRLSPAKDKKVERAPFMANETPECPPHHWQIETPEGSTSRGVCKKCGLVGIFRNSDELMVSNRVLALESTPRIAAGR